jgi:hypothetical protein
MLPADRFSEVDFFLAAPIAIVIGSREGWTRPVRQLVAVRISSGSCMAATAILAAVAYKTRIQLGQSRAQGASNEEIPRLRCTDSFPSGFGICR